MDSGLVQTGLPDDGFCQAVANHVDGSLGCCVLDLQAGALRGLHAPSLSYACLAQALAMAVDFFTGHCMDRVQGLLGRGSQAQPSMELRIESDLHVQLATMLSESVLVILVARNTATLGLTWTQFSRATRSIARRPEVA